MCFGRSKSDIQDDMPVRPAHYAPPQLTYATTPPKASIPVPPVSPLSTATTPPPPSPLSPPYQQSSYQQSSYQQPQEQQQQQQQGYQSAPIAELDTLTPAELAGDGVAPPPGPPPSHSQRRGNEGHQDHGSEDYAPPPGPPPSQQPLGDVEPPPGPPPSHPDYVKPPPGPPPSHLGSGEPEHAWEIAVPDTALFPPPPDLFSGWERSSTTNASEAEAEAGERWCAENPLVAPATLDGPALEARRRHDIYLRRPEVNFRGTLRRASDDDAGSGVWRGRTEKKASDSCVIGCPPLYAVTRDSPLALHPGSKAGGVGGRSKTVYYEVRVAELGRQASLAVGYAALPYPSFRMPGWHRGSLAVHGDDGHRFVNDRWGGKSFVEPMRAGGTYGLGMTFTADAEGRLGVEVFFTREGRLDGRWDLHEETDAGEDLPVTGLEGFHDLSCAVGTFGAVDFEVIFDPAKWLYRDVQI